MVASAFLIHMSHDMSLVTCGIAELVNRCSVLFMLQLLQGEMLKPSVHCTVCYPGDFSLHQWNDQDDAELDFNLNLLQENGPDWRSALLPNSALRTHPMLTSEHLKGRTRGRPFHQGDKEFQTLFQDLPNENDRQYPPDTVRR